MIDTILNKRVIFVAGKGGAGKTTVTAALAMAAASHNKNVLVVETHENDALGSLFGETGFTEKPSMIDSNIWGMRIDPSVSDASAIEEIKNKTGENILIRQIPLFDSDIYDIRGLLKIREHLLSDF